MLYVWAVIYRTIKNSNTCIFVHIMSAMLSLVVYIIMPQSTRGLDGKLFCPCSFRCLYCFISQHCNSFKTVPRDKRSLLYMLASLLIFAVHFSLGKVTRIDGTIHRPDKAVWWCELKHDLISDSKWSSTGMDYEMDYAGIPVRLQLRI